MQSHYAIPQRLCMQFLALHGNVTTEGKLWPKNTTQCKPTAVFCTSPHNKSDAMQQAPSKQPMASITTKTHDKHSNKKGPTVSTMAMHGKDVNCKKKHTPNDPINRGPLLPNIIREIHTQIAKGKSKQGSKLQAKTSKFQPICTSRTFLVIIQLSERVLMQGQSEKEA